jgi:hypothetical protein
MTDASKLVDPQTLFFTDRRSSIQRAREQTQSLKTSKNVKILAAEDHVEGDLGRNVTSKTTHLLQSTMQTCLSREVSRWLLGLIAAGTRFQHFHFGLSQPCFAEEGQMFHARFLCWFSHALNASSVHPSVHQTRARLTL